MLTVQLAYELRDTAIKVNSADPGYTATDLNGHRGPQTIPKGAPRPSGSRCCPTTDPPGPIPTARHRAVVKARAPKPAAANQSRI